MTHASGPPAGARDGDMAPPSRRPRRQRHPKNGELTVANAAALLQVSVATVRRWCDEGVLAFHRHATNDYRLIARDAIDHYLTRRDAGQHPTSRDASAAEPSIRSVHRANRLLGLVDRHLTMAMNATEWAASERFLDRAEEQMRALEALLESVTGDVRCDAIRHKATKKRSNIDELIGNWRSEKSGE